MMKENLPIWVEGGVKTLEKLPTLFIFIPCIALTVSSHLIIVFHLILRVAGTYREVRTDSHKTLAGEFQSRGESKSHPLPKVVSTKNFDMPAPKNTNIQSWKIQLGH